MRHRIYFNYVVTRLLPLLCLSLMIAAITQVRTTAAPSLNQAYYVRYEPGQKMDAIVQIEAGGGVIDYDLSQWQLLAISIPESSVSRLNTTPSISFSERVPVYEPAGEQYPYGLDSVQALDVWDFDRDGILDPGAPTGSGIKVCIIDTGILDTHKDLAATNSSGISQIDGEAWNETISGHGTNVAGIVAANMQGEGLAGVAPGVDLFMVKIFNNNGGWVDGQSNLGAAAKSCIDNGASIISMSLKGDPSEAEEFIFKGIYEDEGVLSVAAAANDGDSSGSVDDYSYPASYDSVISVAAITSADTHATYSNENDQVELAAPGSGVMSIWPVPENGSIPFGRVIDDELVVHFASYLLQSAPGTKSGNLVDGGLCRGEDMSDDWNGKIVLCQRDTLLFRELVGNAEAKGAIATIIIYSEPGQMVGTLATATSIGPVVMVTQESGAYLKASKLGTVATVESGDGSDPLPGPGGYLGLTGTSMAAPHVAGTAALLWDVCPALDNEELRQLLRKTAYNLGDDDGWDMSFGYGLVQAFDGWHHCQAADLGDSPRSYGQVRHTGNGQLRLGSSWGTNSWQRDYPGAGHDDENDDGLTFSGFKVGQEATVDVVSSGSGQNVWVNGWFDFNRDGIFGDEEMVVDGPTRMNTATEFSFNIPFVGVGELLNYRFRLYDKAANPDLLITPIPIGLPATISGGEAEDGFVTLVIPTAVTLKALTASNATGAWIAPVFLFFCGLLLTLVFLLFRWLSLEVH